MALARAGLSVAYHVHSSQVDESFVIIGPFVAIVTAGVTAWLCRSGRTSPATSVLAGIVGGLFAGGTAFSVWELLHHTCHDAIEWFLLGLRALFLGALWAAPLAVPTGLLLGLTAIAIGRLLSVAEPHWLEGRAGLRGSAVTGIMLAQVAMAMYLAHISSSGL